MAQERVLPDKATLAHWINDERLTHQQCADRVYEMTGTRVGRSAVSAMASRTGISEEGPRYFDYIPWHVSMYHIRAYPLRMLRLLGRRDTKGAKKLTAEEKRMLDSWLATLAEKDAIVGYDPDDDTGVHYIPARLKDHDGPAPIRVKQLKLKRNRKDR